MQIPSALAGRVKFRAGPNFTGYDSCITSLDIDRNTSASIKNVAVSDQFRAVAVKVWPSLVNSWLSILVNGQGPAMQDTRALRKWLPDPASSDAEPIAAFHLPSGEHGFWPRQGTPPLFSTWNALTELPMFIAVRDLMEYRTRMLATCVWGPVGVVVDAVALGNGVRRVIYG